MASITQVYSLNRGWEHVSSIRPIPKDLKRVLAATPSHEPIVRIFEIAREHIGEDTRIDVPIEYENDSVVPTLHGFNNKGVAPVQWQCSDQGDLYILIEIKVLQNTPIHLTSKIAFFYRPPFKTQSYGLNYDPFSFSVTDPRLVVENLSSIFNSEGALVHSKYLRRNVHVSLNTECSI